MTLHPLAPRRTLMIGVAVGLFGSPVAGQQTTLTVADHEKAMKEIDYIADDIELHIDAMYWADLGADTDALRGLLERVRSFWEARQAPEAVDFAERALSSNRALSRASGQSDKAAARRAALELRSACKGCHAEYREKTETGFRIKPPDRDSTP